MISKNKSVKVNNSRTRYYGPVFLIITSAITLLASFVLPVCASDISGADWLGIVRVSNNGTLANSVSCNLSLTTAELIEDNYLNATANDTALLNETGADVGFMPGYGSNPWCLWVSSIAQDHNLDYRLYTGNATGGTIRYFPGTEGMTTPDSATLELGDNFTIEQKGWIDTTSVGENITLKEGAFRTYISGSGNITSVMLTYTSPTSFTDPSAAWSDEAKAYDDDTGTRAYLTANIPATSWSDYLQLSEGFLMTNAIRIWADVGGTTTEQIDLDMETGGAWVDIYQGTFDDLAWVTYYLGDIYPITDSRIRLYNDDGDAHSGHVYELDFFEYTTANVTASGVTSGVTTVATSANTTHMWIDIDGATQHTVALAGLSVPDNANVLISCQSAAMPYMEYQEITIDGVQQQYIEWEYNATFTDQSGNDHDATPTFRTGSSDADVSASLISFGPVTQAMASQYSAGDYSTFATAPGSIPQMYTELNVTLPGGDVVNDLADAGSVPRALIWFPLSFLVVAVVGFFAYRFTGSMLFQAIVMAAIMGFFSITGVFGFWAVLIFGIEATAILMATKQFGW